MNTKVNNNCLNCRHYYFDGHAHLCCHYMTVLSYVDENRKALNPEKVLRVCPHHTFRDGNLSKMYKEVWKKYNEQ